MLLAVLLLVISVAACGNSGRDTDTEDQGGAQPTTTAATTPSAGVGNQQPAATGGLPSDAYFAAGEFPFPLPTSTGFRTQADVLANLVEQPHDPGVIIVGTGTTPAGEAMRGWGGNATDSAMRSLIQGGRLMARTQDLSLFEWDPVVVREAWVVENADGSRTFGHRINENLRWSNGERITAYDYIFALLLNSSPEKHALGSIAMDGHRLVGFAAFNSGDSRTFSGVRLYDEFSFSFTVTADNFPYFHAFSFAEVDMANPLLPLPMHRIAPGVTLSDSGSGATWCENLTIDLLRETLLDPITGYRWYPVPSAGPYRFVEFDRASLTYTMEINPYFIATWDGYVPSIQTIALRATQGAVVADEVYIGAVHLASIGVTNTRGNEMFEAGTHGATVFPSASISQFRMFCDVGPTRFREVRQAFAWSIDRDEFALQRTEGHGRVVNSMYFPGSWIHRNNRDWLEDNLTHHSLNLVRAREYLVAGGWVLNENGNPFVEGTDRMRHKMYEGELLPLEIVWASNPNSDVLNAIIYTSLVTNAAQIGMIIHEQHVTSTTAIASRTGFAPGDEEAFNFTYIGSGHGFGSSYIAFWNIFQFEDEAFFEAQRNFFLREQRLNDAAIAMRETDPLDRALFDQRELEMLRLINYYMPALFTYVTDTRWMFQSWLQNFEMGTTWSWEFAIVRAYTTR